MAKFLFLDLVNQYIDDEKKRNKDMRSKSAIYKWIIDDVRDELISINEQYREIDNDDTDAKKVFRDTIIAQFETAHFRKFLKNKSDTKTTHYQNLLYSCFISSETIEDFLEAKRDSNSGTLDFFKAFCQYQEREYGKKTSMPIPIREYPSIPDDIKTETFLIPGATIIDKAFIEKVKSGKTFTMPEFYGAKQNNYCQWYGIIHDYDVERKGYQKLKETLLDSFIEEKDGKVSAIVHGSGGSGKSTVLRRIAVDFHQESFAVIWLERSRVEEFVKSGLLIIKNEIEKNYNRKFLIIIEDWYRMFDDEDKLKLGTKILEITYEMNNVRIVIGDRELKNEYKKYRNNNVELLLSSEDNKEIFEGIIEKYPNWEEASERLFTKEKNHQSSLFLLLFILARIDNKNAIDLSEPQQVFQNIIESDLKYIEEQYEGLAKALYYWANISYRYQNSTITYHSFLKLADHYQKTKKISETFSNHDFEASTHSILSKLKLYIHVSSNDDTIKFHHDLLKIGLKQIILQNGEKYDNEVVVHHVLKVIIKKGDEESTSLLVDSILSYFRWKNENYKKKYLNIFDKLFSKKNVHDAYQKCFFKLNFHEGEYMRFAVKLWEEKFFPAFFWSKFLRTSRERFHQSNDKKLEFFIRHFLRYEDRHLYHQDILIESIRNTKNKIVQQKFIHQLLKSPEWRSFDESLICLSVVYSDQGKTKEDFITQILKAPWNDSIHQNIILTALKENQDIDLEKNYVETFFSNNQWIKKDSSLICKCLTLLQNKNIVENIVKYVVENRLWEKNLDKETIICLIKISGSKYLIYHLLLNEYTVNAHIIHYILDTVLKKEDKEYFYIEVLAREDSGYDRLNLIALNNVRDKKVKKKYIDSYFKSHVWEENQVKTLEILKITEDTDFITLCCNDILKSEKTEYNANLICYLLEHSKSESLGRHFLLKYKQESWSVIASALAIFENKDKLPAVVHQIIEEFIVNYNVFDYDIFKNVLDQNSLRVKYKQIMKYDFAANTIWKQELEKIYSNPMMFEINQQWRYFISEILYNHRKYTQTVKATCSYILDNWEKFVGELFYSISNPLRFLDKKQSLLMIALGHPDLKEKANIAALKINFSNNFKNNKYDDCFIVVIKNIVFKGIYPEWEV